MDGVGGPIETPIVKDSTTEVLEAPKQDSVLEPKKEDLISRVSKFKPEAPIKKEEANPFGLSKEDYDRVQNDPTLSKFYKSMQSDYIKKTQEAAEVKRQAEEIKKQSQSWTKERLQGEINKPDFIQAAQQYASEMNPPNSGLTDQEYSALTDKEKAQLSEMRQQVNQLQTQNWQMHQKQQDEQLKGKYANYAPDIVDTTITRLVNKEAIATREDIWKVVDYENAVQRAYELGKQDRITETNEKQQSASYDGFNATPKTEAPKIEQGESNSKYFQRIARERLREAGNLQTQRR
jgi:hypothetical protein